METAHHQNFGSKAKRPTIIIPEDEPIIKFVRKPTERGPKRPPCIECGSDEVISKGVQWLCKDCGMWFLKIRRAPLTR
jgi:hypothetical protein